MVILFLFIIFLCRVDIAYAADFKVARGTLASEASLSIATLIANRVNRCEEDYLLRNKQRKQHVMVIHSNYISPHRRGNDSIIYSLLQSLHSLNYSITYVFPFTRANNNKASNNLLEDFDIDVLGPLPTNYAILQAKLKVKRFDFVVQIYRPSLPYLVFLQDVNQIIREFSPFTAILPLISELHHSERTAPPRDPAKKGVRLLKGDMREVESYFFQRYDALIALSPDLQSRAQEIVPTKRVFSFAAEDAMRQIIEFVATWSRENNLCSIPHPSDFIPSSSPPSTQPTVLWDLMARGSFSYAAIYHVFPFLKGMNSIKSTSGCPKDNNGTIPHVYIRILWPVNLERPSCCPKGKCTFILFQPWEFGFIPKIWLPLIESNIDYVWGCTSFNSLMFTRSGVPSPKVKTVLLGIDCNYLNSSTVDLRDQLFISPKTIVIGYVGALMPRKGIDILLDAYTSSFGESDDVVLLLKLTYQHGNEALMDKIRIFSNSSEGSGPVRLLEGEYHMGDIYRAIDILVHPARAEGLGLTPMEALGAGKVIIVPDRGAMNDYVSPSFAYQVRASQTNCTVFPCQDDSVCVFETAAKKCEELVHAPIWHEVDSRVLSDSMKYVTRMLPTARERAAIGRQFVCEHFQWQQIATMIRATIYDAIFVAPSEINGDVKKGIINQWKDISKLPVMLRKVNWNHLVEFPSLQRLQ